MRDPNEALVFLSRREMGVEGFHPRLMFVAALYAAGAHHVAIGVDEDARFPSNGATVHLPANHQHATSVERVLEEAIRGRLIRSHPVQRGNQVRVHWAP